MRDDCKYSKKKAEEFLEATKVSIDMIKKSTGVKNGIWQMIIGKTEECLILSDIIKCANNYGLQFLKREGNYLWFKEV